MARVKICGLKTRAMIDVAINEGAEMIGLVHFPKSPRHVSLLEAADLARHARDQSNGATSVVALVVDPDDTLVDQLANEIAPDFIQLHGHETPARTRAIRDHAKLPIIKAFSVSTVEDTRSHLAYAGAIWLSLFDAKPPEDATLPGGNGLAFDWSILTEARAHAPFMLSGGLTPANVAEAIRIADPLYVDVSSGVERAPGEKDADLIRAFITQARSAPRQG